MNPVIVAYKRIATNIVNITAENASEYYWGENPPSIDGMITSNRDRSECQTDDQIAPFLSKG